MTTRLGSLVVENYETLDGYAVAHGVPPLESLPLRRFNSFVYWFFTNNRESSDVEKFRAKLWQPPKGEAPHERSPWSPEHETSAFAALKAGVGA